MSRAASDRRAQRFGALALELRRGRQFPDRDRDELAGSVPGAPVNLGRVGGVSRNVPAHGEAGLHREGTEGNRYTDPETGAAFRRVGQGADSFFERLPEGGPLRGYTPPGRRRVRSLAIPRGF